MDVNRSISLEIRGLTVAFGALTALRDLSFTMTGPARIGLIGPNGAGKTTLLNTVSGFVQPSAGQIVLDGVDVTPESVVNRVSMGLVRSFQTARLLEDESVETNILLGCHAESGPGALRQMFGTPRSRRWERRMRARVSDIEHTLGVSDISHSPVSVLPSATRRLVEVGRVLAAGPKVMLLDEPAAGLDSSERQHLADVLVRISQEHEFLMVLVEHDVSIVRHVCPDAIVLTEGTMLAQGSTPDVLDLPAVRAAYFGGASDAIG